MFCIKCGGHIPDNTMFCPKCGANVEKPDSNRESTARKSSDRNSHTHYEGIGKKITAIVGSICGTAVMAVIVVLFFTKYNATDITDQIANVAQMDNEYINIVKNTKPDYNYDITYEQALSEFLSMPSWKYFVGSIEGPDDDGDGKPDYTESNVKTVELTGYCQYAGAKVKAKIQFRINSDDTCAVVYLAFNDVPQNRLMLSELLNTAFDEYKNAHNMSDTTEPESKYDFVGDWTIYTCDGKTASELSRMYGIDEYRFMANYSVNPIMMTEYTIQDGTIKDTSYFIELTSYGFDLKNDGEFVNSITYNREADTLSFKYFYDDGTYSEYVLVRGNVDLYQAYEWSNYYG